MLRAPLLTLPLVLAALVIGCGSSASGVDASDGGPILPAHPLNGAVADRLAGAPWPGFARDARHNGAADVVGPQDGAVRWKRKLEGPVVPGPAVGEGGVVYAASNGGVLHAIDVRSGKDRWAFDGGGSYGIDLSTVPAVLPDGTVLWPGPRNSVFALDAEGHELWREAFGAQPLSPAVAPDGSVVVGDMSGTLEALELHGDGKPTRRWRVELGGTSYGSVAVGSDGSVYTTTDDALVAVRDGEVRWRFAAGDIVEVSPAVAPDGTIVFGANDDTQYGVTPAGKLRWKYDTKALTYSSPVVTADGLVYFGDHHGFVNALDARTGKLVTRVLGLGRTARRRSVGVWTAPAVDARHDVYFGTRPGHVYGFDAHGKRLFDLDTGASVESYPALAGDGTLLVGSESGFLYALR